METKYITKIIFVLSLIAAFSCSKDDDATPAIDPTLLKVTSVTEAGITATVYAKEPLFVGFNELTIQLQGADGGEVSGAAMVMPMMDMTDMQHACPREYPEGNQVTEGLLRVNVGFVMPSGEMGSWTLQLAVNGTEIEIPLSIVLPEIPRMKSFESMKEDDSRRFFVFLLDPVLPQVGQNDVHLAIYQRQSMMEWPAAEDLTLEMTPWMPSMDHGSPNNVNPVHEGGGHYKGKANFTMTGDWQIRLDILEGSDLLGEPAFDLEI